MICNTILFTSNRLLREFVPDTFHSVAIFFVLNFADALSIFVFLFVRKPWVTVLTELYSLSTNAAFCGTNHEIVLDCYLYRFRALVFGNRMSTHTNWVKECYGQKNKEKLSILHFILCFFVLLNNFKRKTQYEKKSR